MWRRSRSCRVAQRAIESGGKDRGGGSRDWFCWGFIFHSHFSRPYVQKAQYHPGGHARSKACPLVFLFLCRELREVSAVRGERHEWRRRRGAAQEGRQRQGVVLKLCARRYAATCCLCQMQLTRNRRSCRRCHPQPTFPTTACAERHLPAGTCHYQIGSAAQQWFCLGYAMTGTSVIFKLGVGEWISALFLALASGYRGTSHARSTSPGAGLMLGPSRIGSSFTARRHARVRCLPCERASAGAACPPTAGGSRAIADLPGHSSRRTPAFHFHLPYTLHHICSPQPI